MQSMNIIIRDHKVWDVEFRPWRGVYFNDLQQSIFVSTQYFSYIHDKNKFTNNSKLNGLFI